MSRVPSAKRKREAMQSASGINKGSKVGIIQLSPRKEVKTAKNLNSHRSLDNLHRKKPPITKKVQSPKGLVNIPSELDGLAPMSRNYKSNIPNMNIGTHSYKSRPVPMTEDVRPAYNRL